MRSIFQQLFIGGRWVDPSSDEEIVVIGAGTEEVIGTTPAGAEPDIDAAVAAARAAFDDPAGWSAWAPADRAAALERLADALVARADDIAPAVSRQNGMPISLSEGLEGGFPAVLLRYYAGLIREQVVEEVRPGLTGRPIHVRRDPLGVVAAIVPWNAPQTLSSMKFAPALAAGCTMVLKPSPETPLDAVHLAHAVIEAGLPPGVLNIVPGGREVGAYLVAHPGVDKVAFTGSTAAGRQIAASCGALLRPVSLELGGKSAAIVLDDVDVSALGEQFVAATLLNNGQSCFNGTRILAPRSRYEEIVDAVATLAGELKVGDPMDPATEVGPMVSARQRDRVLGYVERGKADGARVVAGGSRPKDLTRGWYVEPTVFADVDNAQVIAQEEIFGPVLVVIGYDDEDEAVRIANDSEYGLGGSVWTADDRRGLDVARRVQTGTIGINHYQVDAVAPFGGVKASGLGREFGPEALSAYQQVKSIYRL